MTWTMMKRMMLATVAAVLAMGVFSSKLVAHEDGVLKLTNKTFPAGQYVRLTGEKFQKNSKLMLVLFGMRGRIELAEITVDSAGAFTDSLEIPADVAPGSWRLIAVATDGDEVATLDVEVLPAMTVPEEMPEDHPMDDAEPSHEPLALDRARNPLVTGTVIGGIGLALLLGGVLLRRSQPQT